MWRFFKKKPAEWKISSRDIRWVGGETSVILSEGWEPFGVSPVPNTLNQNQIRLWIRVPYNLKNGKTREFRIQSAGWGGHQVLLHLTDKWTPFAISMSFDNHIIWFWKEI